MIKIVVGLVFAFAASAQNYTFSTGETAEVTAEIEMSGTGTDWAKPGAEAISWKVSADGAYSLREARK